MFYSKEFFSYKSYLMGHPFWPTLYKGKYEILTMIRHYYTKDNFNCKIINSVVSWCTLPVWSTWRIKETATSLNVRIIRIIWSAKILNNVKFMAIITNTSVYLKTSFFYAFSNNILLPEEHSEHTWKYKLMF